MGAQGKKIVKRKTRVRAQRNGRPMSATEKLVRKALIDRNMDVRTLAQAIGFKQSMVYAVIRGDRGHRDRPVGREIKRAISRYLRIPYKELWSLDVGKRRSG